MSSAASSALASLYNNASPSHLANTPQTAANLDNMFLTLLTTELKNQDPTNPVDSTSMLAQQAQFESLSQMQDLNTNISALIALQGVSQATGLIGMTIVGTSNGTAVTGQVAGIQFVNGTPVLQVNPGGGSTTTVPVQLSNVSSVY